jgi:hypothetical protein
MPCVSTKEALLDPLNPVQREAVLHTDGPVLIVAGAGSGKTRALTHRIAYLIEGIGASPGSILAITFTNKAAREMADRVEGLMGTRIAKVMWILTFHSTCARIRRNSARRALAMVGAFLVELLLAAFENAAAEDAHGAVEILVLAAFVLAFDFEFVGRALLVPDADGALGLVDVLPAGAAGAHALPLDVLILDFDLHLIRFDEDGLHGGVGRLQPNPAVLAPNG